MQEKFRVIGVMSGTSVDGLDIAYCEFNYIEAWKYKLLMAETIDYSREWNDKLINADSISAREFMFLNAEYGRFIGDAVRSFISKYNFTPDYIASHGHTVFHEPTKGFTTQIGSGAEIASKTGVVTVCDFRTSDVALGGQGAPLVPIGDKLLFHDYDACLNLGGFSNVSFDSDGKRIAFDICPVNIVLNYISRKVGLNYDLYGKIARVGKVDNILLKKLNDLHFYEMIPPKSLGKEWVDKFIFPLLDNSGLNENDQMRTFCEHCAIQISLALNCFSNNSEMLVTGGGTHNLFLMDCIKNLAKIKCVVPSKDIVNFKEALIFAFLGVLRVKNEINCLSSVTGASRDNIGGVIYC